MNQNLNIKKMTIRLLDQETLLYSGGFRSSDHEMVTCSPNVSVFFDDNDKIKEILKSCIWNVLKEGIVVENKEGKIVYVNSAFLNMTGFNQQELAGRKTETIFYSNNAPAAEFLQIDDLDSYRCYISKKNGSARSVLLSKTQVHLGMHDYVSVFVTIDITVREQLEKRLQKAIDRAKIYDNLKSAFLANLSHEIRTPLNAIIGFSTILKEKMNSFDVECHEHLNIIESKGYELLETVTSLVEIAKIKSHAIKVESRKIDLNKFLQKNYEKLKSKYGRERQNIKLSLILPDEELSINTDPNLLNKVIHKLVDNAYKFTHIGSIEFGYSNNDDKICFFVRDSGIGISRENIEIIFDEFRQVESHNARFSGGNGLGLNICKNLVALLGGKIWVESELGKGSIFLFTIK